MRRLVISSRKNMHRTLAAHFQMGTPWTTLNALIVVLLFLKHMPTCRLMTGLD